VSIKDSTTDSEIRVELFTKKSLELAAELSVDGAEDRRKAFKLELLKVVDSGQINSILAVKKSLEKTAMQDTGYYQEAVRLAVEALHPRTLTVIVGLLSYANAGELIACLCSMEKFALMLGYKIFTCIYSTFTQKGSFEKYVSDVRIALVSKETSSYKITQVVRPFYPSLPKLVFGAVLGVGSTILYRYLFPYLPAPSVFVDIVAPVAKSVGLDKYFPEDGIVKTTVRNFAQFCIKSGYGIGSGIGGFQDGLAAGYWGKRKDQIDDVLDETTDAVKKLIKEKKKNL
jgi:hypothetical protein